MLAYINIYDKLIEEDTSNFLIDRTRSDAAHSLLIKAANEALNDRELRE